MKAITIDMGHVCLCPDDGPVLADVVRKAVEKALASHGFRASDTGLERVKRLSVDINVEDGE